MNDIRFDITNFQLARDASTRVETEVKESIFGFETVARKMESELASFQTCGQKAAADIREKICRVKEQISALAHKSEAADSGRQTPCEQPPKPTIPQQATPEQKAAIMSDYRENVRRVEAKNEQIRKKNEQIDAFQSACAEAIRQLEQIISKLHQLEDAVKRETATAAAAVYDFQGRSRNILAQGDRVNTAMQQFNHAFYRAYEDALALFLMEPREIRSSAYTHKQFQVRNNHTHVPITSGAPIYGGHRDSTKGIREAAAETCGELLIRDGDEAGFLEKAANVSRVRMPSANLHKLGGKTFTEHMQALGYRIVTQSDGAAIDENGMIHWERDDG